jgi:hypothetical protein
VVTTVPEVVAIQTIPNGDNLQAGSGSQHVLRGAPGPSVAGPGGRGCAVSVVALCFGNRDGRDLESLRCATSSATRWDSTPTRALAGGTHRERAARDYIPCG